ncbi:uncharacterized protein LOC125230643 [Leguminivora glycinivorella]|uniref:uncharacterized protein LOC125230643 n=1 Tax=Leguminivora glycinivorella TaxID=1035111 RepID=UPI00200D7DC8|nr:uncharacterized protein LOC125230643 [Leguminivora glycinivorella]
MLSHASRASHATFDLSRRGNVDLWRGYHTLSHAPTRTISVFLEILHSDASSRYECNSRCKMADEQLIELVRRYEAIYNISCHEYRDATLRNAAWEEIAKLHGKTVQECKEDWNKLRNCYNNAMKRRQKKSGQAGKKIAPWRFEEQMSFLKPYLQGRPTTGNLKLEVDLDNNTMSSNDSFPFLESPTSPASPENIFSRTSTPASNASRKRKTSSSRHDLGDLLEMMKTSQEIRMKEKEMDDLDTFFLSMSKTLKKLPKLDQIRIKMDLLKAISEAEIKQLEAQQNTSKIPIRSQISSRRLI